MLLFFHRPLVSIVNILWPYLKYWLLFLCVKIFLNINLDYSWICHYLSLWFPGDEASAGQTDEPDEGRLGQLPPVEADEGEGGHTAEGQGQCKVIECKVVSWQPGCNVVVWKLIVCSFWLIFDFSLSGKLPHNLSQSPHTTPPPPFRYVSPPSLSPPPLHYLPFYLFQHVSFFKQV